VGAVKVSGLFYVFGFLGFIYDTIIFFCRRAVFSMIWCNSPHGGLLLVANAVCFSCELRLLDDAVRVRITKWPS